MPYGGIGLGGVTMQNEYTTGSAFAYQGILGLGYQLSASIRLFTQYSHISSINKLTVFDSNGLEGTADYQNNLVSVGVTYFLG